MITPDLFVQVRAALDTSLTAVSLPDDTIDTGVYAWAARRQVLAAEPLAEALDPETDADRWRAACAATALLTAARLAPALPQILERTIGDTSMRREKWDAEKMEKRLRALASAELAALTEVEAGSVGTKHFWTIAGRRGY